MAKSVPVLIVYVLLRAFADKSGDITIMMILPNIKTHNQVAECMLLKVNHIAGYDFDIFIDKLPTMPRHHDT